MKQCCTCKKQLEVTEFGKCKSTKDGYQKRCRECRRIAQIKYRNESTGKDVGKKYRQSKRGKITLQQYQDNNRDKITKYKKEYYQQNFHNISMKNKKYYETNRENILKRTTKYRQENEDKIKEHRKQYTKQNTLYKTYKDKLTIDENPRLASDGVSLEAKCRYCGKYFVPTNLQTHNRISSLNGSDNNRNRECSLYCSDGCKQSCPIYRQYKLPKGFKKATSREVQPQLRQMVLKRDNYICQKCGSAEILHCHHILPLNESPIESADVDNCITLCKICHKEVHKIKDCNYYELRCS